MFYSSLMNCLMVAALSAVLGDSINHAAELGLSESGVTSLTNGDVVYERVTRHFVEMTRGDTTVIIVDNSAIDVPNLPDHRAGYNGVASLKHKSRNSNFFVPAISGLNFEHIHDGTTAGLKEKFEPRKFPMQIRRVNEFTVELYQPPTGNWKLESCGRYELLTDGTIEYTFECVPRENYYAKGFIGLFWASYIDKATDKAIHFRAREVGTSGPARWVKAITPKHGVHSTHPPADFRHDIEIDKTFPLTLVGNRSKYEHVDAWYYGVSESMAFALMFRQRDQIWMAQSPSGGGEGNPAWDFQWFIPNPQIGKLYGFTMRAAYLPFENQSQVERATRKHRDALQKK